jgi:hypothetical protein
MTAEVQEQIRASLQAHITQLEYRAQKLREQVQAIEHELAWWRDLLNQAAQTEP